MTKFVGVDWASKRWIVVIDDGDSVQIEAQPSLQAMWDAHSEAKQILIDIPIGLPDRSDPTPRTCDEKAREVVSSQRKSTIFDVPCREAVQTSDYQSALNWNIDVLEDDSLGPQKWGFSERIHEADVFMRRTDTKGRVRESHPEVCFAGLSNTAAIESSKKNDEGHADRREIFESHDEKYVVILDKKPQQIQNLPPWKRRIGVGMIDDIVDAMALALTARLGYQNDFEVLGGETDSIGLSKEIIYYEV